MSKKPKNLDECIAVLEKSLSKKDIKAFKDRSLTTEEVHHTLGRSLRNNWNLWGESKLKDWFNNIGIHHPDDMSDIILKSFVRYIRDEPINLEKQVKFYQDYWEEMKESNNGNNGYIEFKINKNGELERL